MILEFPREVRQAHGGAGHALGSACDAADGRRRMSSACISTAVRTWLERLRRLPLYERRSEPAYATRLLGDGRRWTLSRLAELADEGPTGVVLVIDHGDPGAIQALRDARAACPLLFEKGIVVAVERLSAGDAGGLACYRDLAQAPVLAVNMRRPQDLMLLWVTSVAIRVGIDVL
ncbi:hypothetical protein [Variovorax sp. YR752]|uniref:hypothetical protein n=1 Tax=Variovorax sp. YR752 TaxID=1884383 RepID=UPI00313794AB